MKATTSAAGWRPKVSPNWPSSWQPAARSSPKDRLPLLLPSTAWCGASASRIPRNCSPVDYDQKDIPVYFNQDPAFAVAEGRPGGGGGSGSSGSPLGQNVTSNAVPIHIHAYFRPLSGGQAISERPLVLDANVGKGYVVIFALRPFWRWQTQGTFFLGFNAILNWDHLDAGKPAPKAA